MILFTREMTIFAPDFDKNNMIQSMTGFGKATTELPTKKVTVEVKALNSKQFDIFTRIPPIYREKEMEIRSVLSQVLERGKIEFNINIESIGKDTDAKINFPVVESYKNQIEIIAQALHISQPTEWFPTLLRLPDAIKTEMVEAEEEEWKSVFRAIQEAISKLCDFRKQEGKILGQQFEQNISNIFNLLKQVEPYEKERLEKIRSRITDNLNKIPDVQVDSNRLEQEMIYYIERLDINEEKVRLENHLNYFIETLNSQYGQGKKLGFIVQEIGREINTLGAKSNHVEMQQIVVQMKDELEKIKEQLLNVL